MRLDNLACMAYLQKDTGMKRASLENGLAREEHLEIFGTAIKVAMVKNNSGIRGSARHGSIVALVYYVKIHPGNA